MSRLSSVLLLSAAFLVLPICRLVAQTNPNAGILMWSTNDFGINLATSGINIDIPLRSKTAGSIPFSSQYFATNQAYFSAPYIVVGGLSLYSYTDTTDVNLFDVVTVTSCPKQPSEPLYEITILGIKDPTGANHPVGPTTTSPVWDLSTYCPGSSGVLVAGDGSGYTLAFSISGLTASYKIYDRAGHYWAGTCSESEGATSCGVLNIVNDPDNNQLIGCGDCILGASVTDTLGTAVLTGNGTPVASSYSYADQGTTQYYTPVTSNIGNYKTNFNCPNEPDTLGGPNFTQVTSVTIPTTGTYTFAYEPTPNGNGFTNTNPPTYFTGRIAKITFPSGGSISYAYSGGNNGLNCNTLTVPKIIVTVNDNNGNANTYSYVNTESSAPSNYFVMKTDPAGNQTLYYFAGMYQTQMMSYQGGCSKSIYAGCAGGGTLSQTTTTCYNGNLSSCATPSSVPTLPISETDVYTSIYGSSSNRVQTIYDCQANPRACYSNPVQVSQYDFGASSPTITTLMYYGQSWNGSNGCNAYPSGTYINNTPCYIETQNAGNNVVITSIGYSNTGHPTSVSKWNGTSYLTSTATYNSNGTIHTSTDVAGNQTTFGYTGSCSNPLLPTEITPPVAALAVSVAWDCNGGVPISYTDANGAVTKYGYVNESGTPDPLWRLLSVTDPLSNVTWTDYSPGTTLPETVEAYLNFPSSSPTSTVDTLNTLDGLGRIIQSKKRTAPGASTFDNTVSYTYGWNSTGAKATQTIPGGSAVNTTQFDATGRTLTFTDAGGGVVTNTYSQNDELTVLSPAPSGENVKQVQNQYDGLGRITKICAIGNGATTACAQNSGTADGVTTSYVYTYASGSSTTTATRASQTRSATFDALGRVTQKLTPEGGLWNFYYDSYSSCPSGYRGATGQLAASKDPIGNLICYAYDSLNRVTGVNANNTSCRHFFYDNSTGYSGSIPSGVTTPTNPLSRVVEAATDSCASNTLITDEWFSYEATGRMTDMWEYTPRSKVYYHTAVGYYANGIPQTLSGLPGYSTLTYGVDGEGRWNSAMVGTIAVVSGVSYDAASRPTVINIGSGTDEDEYAYDVMERMKQYQFFVGSQNNKGVLNWSPNSSLGQLAITDGFNANNTQICNYLYDDLMRVAGTSNTPGVNCVNGSTTVWSQTFSYDQYDNLTTSGSLSWIPGYNQANNQYQNGATYDSDGDLTKDGAGNTYTWNAYEKMATVNGTAITYDASGRPVTNGSIEILYTPVGKVGVLQSASEFYGGHVLLPGGGEMALGCCTSDNIWYLHRDWMGTSRVISSVPASGNGTVYNDRSFSPYGQEYQNSGYNDPLLFGDMNADLFATSGTGALLYDTPNRELAINASRWLSPDPAGVGWNQYGYVTNPLNTMDPSGLGPQVGQTGCPPANINPTGPCNQFLGTDPMAGNGCQASIDGGAAPCNLLGGLGGLSGYGDSVGYVVLSHSSLFPELQPFAPPNGPGWGPPGTGDTDLIQAGCLANGINDLEWCPGNYISFSALKLGQNMPEVRQWRPHPSTDIISTPYTPTPYKPDVIDCLTGPNDAVERMLESAPLEHDPTDAAAVTSVYQNSSRGWNPAVSPETVEQGNALTLFFAGVSNFIGCMFNAF